jgi:hypothetical protein
LAASTYPTQIVEAARWVQQNPNLKDQLLARAGASGTPFYGYYYRVLTSQGKHARGGAKSYLVDGKMTGGFAFVVFPAEYKSSGVMTFIVDKAGVVYEKDLGPQTAEIVQVMKEYNPDSTWRRSE